MFKENYALTADKFAVLSYFYAGAASVLTKVWDLVHFSLWYLLLCCGHFIGRSSSQCVCYQMKSCYARLKHHHIKLVVLMTNMWIKKIIAMWFCIFKLNSFSPLLMFMYRVMWIFKIMWTIMFYWTINLHRISPFTKKSVHLLKLLK